MLLITKCCNCNAITIQPTWVTSWVVKYTILVPYRHLVRSHVNFLVTAFGRWQSPEAYTADSLPGLDHGIRDSDSAVDCFHKKLKLNRYGILGYAHDKAETCVIVQRIDLISTKIAILDFWFKPQKQFVEFLYIYNKSI